MMKALMLRRWQGPETVLSFGLIWTYRRDMIAWPPTALNLLPLVGSEVGRKYPLSLKNLTIVSEIAAWSAPESMRHAKLRP